MMLEIHPDGFILGGACHRRLNDRSARNVGADTALDDALQQGCISFKNGWGRIVKEIKLPTVGSFGGGNAEIGYLRMCRVVFRLLLSSKKPFRMSWMEKWIIDLSRLEFGGIGGSPLGPFKCGLAEPNARDDVLYAKGHANSYKQERIRRVMAECD